MTTKDVKNPAKVEPKAPTAVTEVPEPELKVRNPYLTVRVNVPKLPVYERSGSRDAVMKTVRAWIRQRGLTVQLPGVVIEDTNVAGEEVEVDGEKIRADLKVINFSAQCILDAGVTVNVPQKRQPKAQKEPKEAKVTAAKDAKAPAAKPAPTVTADAKAKPADW